jgi:hypothetical protein
LSEAAAINFPKDTKRFKEGFSVNAAVVHRNKKPGPSYNQLPAFVLQRLVTVRFAPKSNIRQGFEHVCFVP